MRKQKRVAVINDVTGFGRCAAAVAQPIISAMKMQCCVLPTAILSVHTGFPDYFLHDFTPYLKEYIDSWEKTGIAFDGICSGFIGSKEQISLVVDFLSDLKKKIRWLWWTRSWEITASCTPPIRMKCARR